MEDEKRVYVRSLKEKLELEQISGDDESLNRWIITPDINRPGLELAGFFKSNDLKRVVIIGNKETDYIDSLDERTLRERFEYITDIYTPCIIVTSHKKCPKLLLEIARYKNFPVFESQIETYQMTVDVVSYLSEILAPSESVHGVMMNIYGNGVMITGPSGIGKSELALDLIKRGHMLVSDDRVDVARVHSDIIASAPDVLKGMLEIRGLGVVDAALLFGGQCILDRCQLDLVIELSRYGEEEFDRVNPEDKKTNILGLDITMVKIPVSDGRPISAIVEAAVANHILKKQGINTTEIFKEKVIENIEKNKEKL